MKKIYLEPAGKIHSAYKELMLHPPQGYEFVTEEGLWQKSFDMLLSNDFFFYSVLGRLRKLLPLHIAKAGLERFRKTPKGIDLTFSCGHLVFRKEPWVAEIEWLVLLIDFHMKHLNRYQKLLETALASDYCKKIICMTELTKKTFLMCLDCSEFEHKLETVYRTIHSKEFIKSYNNEKIKILFVGSVNIPGEFEDEKGGMELIEVFTVLNKHYDNLELIIRSDVPEKVKDACRQISNIKIIDRIIPWDELEQEFKSADIFLLPAHYTPSLAFLDAMSYELPVVTIDSWANSEIVEDGKTGFVVTQPEGSQLPMGDFGLGGKVTPFQRGVRKTNPEVVQGLVEKVSILIENNELRKAMGKAARWEVEQGKFSIEKRNEKMKRIFDEATS